jgi:branched-subunit amino acid ABC-type transport system permease component
MITWVLAAGLGAISGVVLAYSTGVMYPRMGFELLLVVFAAVILGGIGSPYGAMLGAYLISIAQEFSILIPGVGARYRLAVAFIIMVATLMFKPTGILGEEWKL